MYMYFKLFTKWIFKAFQNDLLTIGSSWDSF
jgi:hypothetical protein